MFANPEKFLNYIAVEIKRKRITELLKTWRNTYLHVHRIPPLPLAASQPRPRRDRPKADRPGRARLASELCASAGTPAAEARAASASGSGWGRGRRSALPPWGEDAVGPGDWGRGSRGLARGEGARLRAAGEAPSKMREAGGGTPVAGSRRQERSREIGGEACGGVGASAVRAWLGGWAEPERLVFLLAHPSLLLNAEILENGLELSCWWAVKERINLV